LDEKKEERMRRRRGNKKYGIGGRILESWMA
jgi:hypothetical protein